MLSIAMRTGLVATALVLSGAAAGCLGDDGEADESADGEPTAVIGGFAELERRPLKLPNVEVPASATPAERKFQRHADNCWSWGAPEPGAIVLHAIGEAPLGPYAGEAKLERGPVYAALLRGAPRIVFLSEERMVRGSRSRAVATLWVSRPSYDGPVLVRGARLDRPGRIGFGWGARPRYELRLPASAPWPSQPTDIPPGWRAAKIPTRIRDPGCYALQVDGRGFSYVLPFAVLKSLY
jgi:hypothetical protein